MIIFILGVSLTLNLIAIILVCYVLRINLFKKILNECVVDKEAFREFFHG